MPIKTTAAMVAVMLTAIVWAGCAPKRVGPADADGKRLTWAEMNKAQRKAHMKTAILPKASAIFRDWQPSRFAGTKISCGLCHGSGAKSDNFDMPTDHLPRLSGDVWLRPEFEKHPETTRLKLTRLVPTIADALGVKKFSLITRTGFGCYSCHLGPDGPLFGT